LRKELIVIKDEVNIPCELSGYVKEMSVQQNNTDSTPHTEFVKVEMAVDDMLDYAVEEDSDVNLTLTEPVKVELSVEYNSSSEETSVKMEKTEHRENSTCSGQLCKDMLGVTVSKQINAVNIPEGIAHQESSVDLKDKEEIG
jgi:hypothetical protein